MEVMTFKPVKDFVIRNSYYADHAELREALDRYAAYRNRHVREK